MSSIAFASVYRSGWCRGYERVQLNTSIYCNFPATNPAIVSGTGIRRYR